MGVFDFLKKGKAELSDEQKKWNKMWDLWTEGRADSPYKELMSYQSEVNNGGHDQYFFNTENTDDLQKELSVLEAVLPKKLEQCDDTFYKNEEEINRMLQEYAAEMKL